MLNRYSTPPRTWKQNSRCWQPLVGTENSVEWIEEKKVCGLQGPGWVIGSPAGEMTELWRCLSSWTPSGRSFSQSPFFPRVPYILGSVKNIPSSAGIVGEAHWVPSVTFLLMAELCTLYKELLQSERSSFHLENSSVERSRLIQHTEINRFLRVSTSFRLCLLVLGFPIFNTSIKIKDRFCLLFMNNVGC